MARKRSPYFTLAVLIEGRWSPEFGAYERDDVQSELAGYLDSGAFKRKEMKILRTEDTQEAINKAIAALNGEA